MKFCKLVLGALLLAMAIEIPAEAAAPVAAPGIRAATNPQLQLVARRRRRRKKMPVAKKASMTSPARAAAS